MFIKEENGCISFYVGWGMKLINKKIVLDFYLSCSRKGSLTVLRGTPKKSDFSHDKAKNKNMLCDENLF